MPRRKRNKDGIFWRDGHAHLQWKGKRVSLKTTDPAEARTAAKAYKLRVADPAHQAAHVKPLKDAIAEFREYAKTGENRKRPPSDATFEMYDTHFGHFVRLLGGETPMDEIDAPAIDDYIAARRSEHIGKAPEPGQPDNRRKVEANTVDKELGTMRQLLRLGLRRGWFHLPLERVLPESSGAEYVPLTRFLTLEQVPLLLEALEAQETANQKRGGYIGVYKHRANPGRWESKITLYKNNKRDQRYLGYFDTPIKAALAYDAAARELVGPHARTNFPPEGAPRREPSWRAAYCAYIVAFAADVVALTRVEREDLGDENHASLLVLVRGTKNAKRWDWVPVIHPFGQFSEIAREYLLKHGSFPEWANATRDLAAACKRAGLPRVTPRDLRRSHGKILAALGVDAQRIGEMMRHTTSRMAQTVYAVPERLDVRQHTATKTRRAS